MRSQSERRFNWKPLNWSESITDTAPLMTLTQCEIYVQIPFSIYRILSTIKQTLKHGTCVLSIFLKKTKHPRKCKLKKIS